jgi:hypothetical protein
MQHTNGVKSAIARAEVDFFGRLNLLTLIRLGRCGSRACWAVEMPTYCKAVGFFGRCVFGRMKIELPCFEEGGRRKNGRCRWTPRSGLWCTSHVQSRDVVDRKCPCISKSLGP